MNRHHLSMLTAALLLASLSTTACGGDNTGADTTALTDTSDTTATEIDDGYLSDNLPDDLDLGGAIVTIHVRGNDNTMMEVDTDAEDGEVLNDAIYSRNRRIEERLNASIALYNGEGWANYNSEITKIRASISAGDNAWQIIAGWGINITTLSMENCFLDLQNAAYLDLSQPWWNQSAVNGLTLGGATYFATGDVSFLSLLGGSYVMFLNDRLASVHNVEDIPDLVRAGTWTLDKLSEISKNISADLNGDGIFDEHDLYGFVTDLYNSADSFYTAADIHQITVEDGLPVYTTAEERLTTLMEKIYPLYHGGNEAGSYMTTDVSLQVNMFYTGQALIIPRELDTAREEFREMEDNYTIIPFPKLDEAQKSYYTASYNGATLWGIPSTNPEPDIAAAIMEAMAAETYNTVTPVYFETCLQEKYARNEDTLEMLEIIRETSYLDCEYLYSASFKNTYYAVRSMIGSKNNNAASWLAKNVKSYQKAVDAMTETLLASNT